MHIPDHYLSPQTCAVMTAAVIPAWAVSIKKIRLELPLKKISLMGVGAAFSFLGMMFNIPLPGGTTGHAVGGTLIAILLGPYAACISVSMALLLQALLFGDGGILAFGANCFNMAFVLPFVGYAVACMISPALRNTSGIMDASGSGTLPQASLPQNRKRNLIAAAIGSYAGINAASLCAAIEFGIQPMLFRDAAGNALYCPYDLRIAIPGMMIGHLTVFGLAEVIFTVAVLSFVFATMADNSAAAVGQHTSASGTPASSVQAASGSVVSAAAASGSKGDLPLKVLLGALIVLTPLGLLAEGTAWGEWGVDEIAATGAGYTPQGMLKGFSFEAILPDYSLEGLPDWTAYILAAVIGTALLLIIFRVAAALASKKVGESAA